MNDGEQFGEGVGHNSDTITLERQCEGAKPHVEAIETAQSEIDKLAEEYKAKSAPFRDAIAAEKKKCREDFGFEAKALTALLTKRRQERRMQARIDALEDTARAQFDLFQEQSN